jgi:ATP-dependent helicase/nuclease subunit A
LPHETQPEIKTRTDALFQGDGAEGIFTGVDKLLERYAKSMGDESEKFDQRSFGTLAHICVEALFSGREAAIPPKLAGSLTPNDAAVFLEAGKELAARFARSPLGIKARESTNRKSEFPFRTLAYGPDGNEIFINVTIDLFFEDEETFYVVDFKTDSFEQPEAHVTQMTCYHRAVSELSMSLSNQKFAGDVSGVLFAAPSAKACRVWLYYLRSGRAVEVSGFSFHPR